MTDPTTPEQMATAARLHAGGSIRDTARALAGENRKGRIAGLKEATTMDFFACEELLELAPKLTELTRDLSAEGHQVLLDWTEHVARTAVTMQAAAIQARIDELEGEDHGGA